MSFEKYSKKFDEIYKQRIEPFIKPLETIRAQKYGEYKRTLYPALILPGLLILFFPAPIDTMLQKLIIMFFVGVTVHSIVYTRYFGKFAPDIKKKLLPAILKSFGDFYIANEPIISSSEIKSYQIFPAAKRTNVDDIITGFYKEMAVSIQETRLTHTEGSGKTSHTVVDFAGLIIKVKFPKNFRGLTVVSPDKSGSRWGSELQKVNLEDPEFEKIYDVYSTDQIEARYLLTTAFMERLRTLSDNLNLNGNTLAIGRAGRTYCVFDQGYVLLFVGANHDFFEVFKANKCMLDKEIYRYPFLEMIMIFNLIKTLKIDQKIGL